MALRHSRELTFRAATLCDAIDGTNGPPGGMQNLVNLVPDPSTAQLWVPRPAAQDVSDFAPFTTPGFISGSVIIGDIEYGTIASGLHPGFDQPYAFNLATGTFLTVSGVTATNVPISPASSGDWTPPILAQVGPRIIVTHPGFNGAPNKIGWFDVSGFSLSTTGNTTNSGTQITGNPTILGVAPGMVVAGTGIQPGTSVTATAAYVNATQATTHSNTTLDGIANVAGLAVGQVITGAASLGIPAGTTIMAISGPAAVTMSNAATLSATGNVTFTGATITMSLPAISTNSQETITVNGGTAASPQWGAGDTNINNLPSVPVGVAQFNGRAYYACGVNGIPFSDSLQPTQISNATVVQILTTNDGLAVTAIGPLMQYAALTGGIVQGLIAFEGASKMQQITGDLATNNLSMNALPVATGTLAPLSVVPCELGLMFVSPDGLRIIGFTGNVSPPIGDSGKGVTVPFIYATFPSRICAAANADTIRISVINGALSTPTPQEYWFDITRKLWSGPHGFPASSIQPWRHTFVKAVVGINAKLWQSDVVPNANSNYVENGTQLSWVWQTSLFPDNASMAMNAVIETMMGFTLLGGSPVSITAFNEGGQAIDTVEVQAQGNPSLWGQFNWGQANWGGNTVAYRQYSLNWHFPIVFKQMSIQAQGTSAFSVRIGNLYARYEVLGYKNMEPLTGPAARSPRLLSDTGIPLTSDTGAPLTGL